MGFLEELRNFSERAKQRKPNLIGRGEAATQHALIAPFFAKLGYDVEDPSEVQPEYDADFDRRKPRGQPERVDYAIFCHGKPAIFVECKAVNVILDNHDGQLRRYFNSNVDVHLAILTNGLRYKFFTDLVAENIMDSDPFLEFEILNLQEQDAEMIERFTKAKFRPSNVRNVAREFIFTRHATPIITDLINNPRTKLIPFIMNELGRPELSKGSDAAHLFEPIVKRLLHSTLHGLADSPVASSEPATDPSISAGVTPPGALSSSPTDSNAPPRLAPDQAIPGQPAETGQNHASQHKQDINSPSHTSNTNSGTKDGTGGAPLDEKLEIFQLVAHICAKSQFKSPVKSTETARWFSINLGTPHSWFLRLFPGTRRKSFVTRLPVKQAEQLAIGYTVDSPPDVWGVSRIYFGSSADVEKLSPLIMAAYEVAMKRKEAGDAELSEPDE